MVEMQLVVASHCQVTKYCVNTEHSTQHGPVEPARKWMHCWYLNWQYE